MSATDGRASAPGPDEQRETSGILAAAAAELLASQAAPRRRRRRLVVPRASRWLIVLLLVASMALAALIEVVETAADTGERLRGQVCQDLAQPIEGLHRRFGRLGMEGPSPRSPTDGCGRLREPGSSGPS